MKISAFLAVLVALIVIFGFRLSRVDHFEINDVKFLRINDSLFVSETEITQNQFHLFELFKGERLLDDGANCWEMKVFSHELIREYYSDVSQFGDYPVLNVEYKIIEQYCDWLRSNSVKRSKDIKEIRLPKFEEWKLLSGYASDSLQHSGLDDSFYWGDLRIYDKNGERKANLFVPFCYSVRDCDEGPWKVRSGLRNKHGLYGVTGNVSEILHGGKKVIGGSYYSRPENGPIFLEDYFYPNCESGFRLIAVIGGT
jgi:formylglycine-generating enzyme required for sulfatase activity